VGNEDSFGSMAKSSVICDIMDELKEFTPEQQRELLIFWKERKECA